MKEITPQQLVQMKASGKEFQLIDVREPYEHEMGCINGELIPMGELMDRLDEIRKDIPVVIHCKSGKRACAVIETLERLHGYQNLHNLQGGIEAYAEEVDPTLEIA